MSRAANDRSAAFTWDRSIDVLERVLTEAVEQFGAGPGGPGG
jgi:hypothetical protein